MKKLLVILVILLPVAFIVGYLLFSARSKPTTVGQQAVNPTDTPFPTMVGIPTTYVGTLPCADCSGLKVQLTMYRENPSQTSGKYDIQNTYLGTKGKPQYTKGTWKTITGDKTDPKATVFMLTADKGDTQYFFKINENKVKMLSKQLAEIQSPFNYTLVKQ